MTPPATRIHALDGLRGLLALYVAVYHLAAPLTHAGMALAPIRILLEPAWFAVDMFFVMSGFVMAHVYAASFGPGADPEATWRFFVARIARLYPVHLFALAVMAAGILPAFHDRPEFTDPDGRFAWTAALASLAMLHGPWIDHRTWNYPAWSISAEWHAYLLFPMLAPLLAKLRSAGRLRIVALGVLLPFVLYQFELADETHPTNGLLLLMRVLPLFAAGAAAHGLRDAAWARSDTVALLAFAGTPLLLLGPGTSAAAVLLAPCVLLAAVGHPLVRRFLSRAWLLRLGAISYSLYMTHALVEMGVVNVALRGFKRHAGIDIAQAPAASTVLLIAATLVALGVGAFTWRWVELPGRRLIGTIALRRPQPATRQPSTP